MVINVQLAVLRCWMWQYIYIALLDAVVCCTVLLDIVVCLYRVAGCGSMLYCVTGCGSMLYHVVGYGSILYLSRYYTLYIAVRGLRIWPLNAAKCCKNASKFFPDIACR